MAESDGPSREPAHDRKFLEKLLADCRRSGWPGQDALLKSVEQALAELRSAARVSDNDRDYLRQFVVELRRLGVPDTERLVRSIEEVLDGRKKHDFSDS